MPRVKAAPPRMPDRPGRWKLLLRRQRRMLRPALAGFVLIAGIGMIGMLVHVLGEGAGFGERLGYATARMGLRVQNVVIEGRQKTPENLLRAALGLRSGEPILTYSVRDARARIETINWVQSATVERRLPGTILVRLTERRPFAVWQHEGKFELVDRKGDMVTDSDVASFSGQLPLVVGIGAPKAAADLLDALAARPDLQARIVAAVRVGERRWNLHMNNGTDVLLPEGAEAQALTKLMELQTSHALLDRPLQVVDLRLPDRLVVRPSPDKPNDKSGADKPGEKADTARNPARKPT